MKAVTAFLLVLGYLALSDAAWNCQEALRLSSAAQIDAGHGRVVVTTTSRYPYTLIGNSWYRLTTLRFKHVSVGPAGLWGSDTSNRVYKYVAGNFLQTRGPSMQQVDAGGDDQVVGATTSSYASCLISSSALAYSRLGYLRWRLNTGLRLRYYSCSPADGCWGVDNRYRVHFVESVAPSTCTTANRSTVTGSNMKMVEVGTDGKVFAVNRLGNVYQRLGITNRRRQGTRWVQVPMCMRIRHVSWDLGKLWVVTNSGLIMKCTP